MRLDFQLLSLPTSILILIASYTISVQSAEEDSQSPAQWPYNLPPHVKFWPEDPPHRRRDLEAIEEHLRLGRKPVGVMKMSTDEGEKFYPEYWQFEGELEQTVLEAKSAALREREEEEEDRLLANVSTVVGFRPPFLLHTEHKVGSEELKNRELRARDTAEVLATLRKRAFTCPTGTSDCSGIGYPGSCCTTNEVCFKIMDTGLGPVGCCPAGGSCGGTITHCDAPNTACAASLGGGCCIPNYVCVEGGCAMNSSLIVTTVITQTFTVTASSSTRTSTSVSTVVSTSTTSACPLNVQSCAASLGGGCCPTDRVCALSSCAPLPSSSTTTIISSVITTTTATGAAPIRPTSGSSSTTSTTQSSAAPTSCPTGFYACEAYYEGGCCRTGRNCQKTSCPPTSSTTIISSGVTIVVPVGSAAVVATPTGACASGWSTCAASVGGNCCPSDWACGTASCSSVAATGTAVLQKASPGEGRRIGVGRVVMVGFRAFVVGFVMI